MTNAILIERKTVLGALTMAAALVVLAIVLAQPLGRLAFLGVAIRPRMVS